MPVENDGIKESLINQIKKKGPSYAQLQKKKRKPKKKANKGKQTFYEKVLSKTIGQPTNNESGRHVGEPQYYADPMNKTQNVKYISSNIPEGYVEKDAKR